ncbi:MAG: hypothetical protein ACYTDT_10720 [Planctomycetota bacterium]|jgi:hypothetical protein
MMRVSYSLILLLLVGCSIGTTTSDRPALTKPPIGPDGVTWDAYLAAQRGDRAAFRNALSIRFIHSHLLPDRTREATRTEKSFAEEESRLLAELEPEYSKVVIRMLDGLMAKVSSYGDERLMETSKPKFEIDFKDRWGRAKGPNIAWVTMRFHDLDAEAPEIPKDADPEEAPPAPDAAFELKVRLVQSGQRWVVDGFEPDELKGAFSR